MAYRENFQNTDLSVVHIADSPIIADTEAMGSKLRIREMLGEVERVILNNVPIHLRNNTIGDCLGQSL